MSGPAWLARAHEEMGVVRSFFFFLYKSGPAGCVAARVSSHPLLNRVMMVAP